MHAIEWAWWERFRAGRVYLYLMPTTTFELHAAEAGYYVSREAVTPLARIEIDDLVRKHAESGVELRRCEAGDRRRRDTEQDALAANHPDYSRLLRRRLAVPQRLERAPADQR